MKRLWPLGFVLLLLVLMGQTLGPAPSLTAVTCAAHQFANLVSVASSTCAQPAVSDISGFGTGVATALGTNVGSAGSPLLKGTRSISTPSQPNSTSSTTLVMAGLAQSATPSATGNLLIIITGWVANSTVLDGCTIVGRYGTGTAPNNGDPVTGTNTGGNGQRTTSATANANVPFTVVGYVAGLTVSTAYWLDFAFDAVTGGTCSPIGITFTVIEL